MITTITAITPTAAPALNIPAIAEQLLKQNNNKKRGRKYSFFIVGFIAIIFRVPNKF